MKIRNEFRVAATVEQAWQLLTDIEAIAPCLPGARITGSDGDIHQGTMKVKVGPITAEYAGTATITELDEAGRRVLLSADGRDKRGAGNASAEIEAVMVDDPKDGGTIVTIDTELRVAGKVAQFGRGVMADVSTKLIGQFSECVEAKLAGSTDVESPGGSLSADPASTGDHDPSRTGAVEPEALAAADNQPDVALDLLDVAGAALAKRLVPVALLVVAAVVLLLVLLL